MSAGWIFVVFLFITPSYEAAEAKDDSSRPAGRQRRSLAQLADMVQSVTGRRAQDFLDYGNWCGLGGANKPLDPIDECCQNHDICYNASKKSSCKEYERNVAYTIEYKWRLADDETAVCDDGNNLCQMTVCLCDAVLTNCIKSNLEFYDGNKLKEVDFVKLAKDYDYIMG